MATVPLQSSPDVMTLLQSIVGGKQNQEQVTTQDTTVQNTGTTKVESTADLDALRAAQAKQAAGVTPEMIAAIFQEGAKATPGLVQQTANSIGARAGANVNTPLATVLQALQMDMTSKAADLSRQMLGDSAQSAAKIGELTRGTTTTDNRTQTTEGKTGTNAETSNTLNYNNAGKLLGAMFGNNVLQQLVPGGLGGLVTSGAQGIAGLIKQILPALGGSTGSSGFNTAGTVFDDGSNLIAKDFLQDPNQMLSQMLLGGGTSLYSPQELDALVKQLTGGTELSLFGDQPMPEFGASLDNIDFNSLFGVPDLGAQLTAPLLAEQPTDMQLWSPDDPGFWE